MNAETTCLTDGELRLLADNEATTVEAFTRRQHLAGCPACTARLARIERGSGRAATMIIGLASSPNPPDAAQAYRRWRVDRLERQRRRQIRMLERIPLMRHASGLRRRSALIGTALVALMVVAIAALPVGTLAEDVLNKFRVQQFSAITIPIGDLEGLGSQLNALDPQMKAAVADEFIGLGSFSTTFNRDALHQGATLDEARAHLGGSLKSPTDLPSEFDGVEPSIYLSDAGTAEYTLNVAKAQEVLGRFGLSSAGLPDPATNPTATVTLDVPAAAVFVYEANGKHLLVGQMASPTLSIPDSIDVELLREEILAFPLLPADTVAQIRGIENWEETLIIPVPSDATTSQKTVDGSDALLIEHQGGSAVLWQDGGTLYIVAGQVSGDAVMRVANSM